jgi:hypothetical protein
MKTCETCAAYSALAKECRAHAPQPVMLQGPNGQSGVVGIFPASKPDNWCAEWRAETKE